MITIYSMTMLVWGSRYRWTLASTLLYVGFAGWAIGGIGAVIDSIIPINFRLHNTTWVVAHFHTYLILTVVVWALAFLAHLLERDAGRTSSRAARTWTVGLILVGGYGLTGTWFVEGVLGVPRRYAIQPPGTSGYSLVGSIFALLLALGFLAFFLQLIPLARDALGAAPLPARRPRGQLDRHALPGTRAAATRRRAVEPRRSTAEACRSRARPSSASASPPASSPSPPSSRRSSTPPRRATATTTSTTPASSSSARCSVSLLGSLPAVSRRLGDHSSLGLATVLVAPTLMMLVMVPRIYEPLERHPFEHAPLPPRDGRLRPRHRPRRDPARPRHRPAHVRPLGRDAADVRRRDEMRGGSQMSEHDAARTGTDGLWRWLLGGLAGGGVILGLLIAAYAIGYHRGARRSPAPAAHREHGERPHADHRADSRPRSEPVTVTPALVARGKALYTTDGCSACHSLTGAAGAGPSFKGLAGGTSTLADGQTVTADDAYLERSIADPDAQIVKGYRAGLMAAAIAGFDLAAQARRHPRARRVHQVAEIAESGEPAPREHDAQNRERHQLHAFEGDVGEVERGGRDVLAGDDADCAVVEQRPQPEGLHQEDRNYATEQRERPVARLPRDDDGEHAGDDELDEVESVEHQTPDTQPERRRDSRGVEFERRLDHRDAEDEAEPQERQGNGDQLFGSSHRNPRDPRRRLRSALACRDGLERLLEACSGAQLGQREELAFLETDVRLEENAALCSISSSTSPWRGPGRVPSRQSVQSRHGRAAQRTSSSEPPLRRAR